MATYAGAITTTATAPALPQWVPCDGSFYYVNDPKRAVRPPIPGTASTGTRWDYVRRVGTWGRSGGICIGTYGWIIRVPLSPGFSVSLADDNSDVSTPPNTVQKPPAGTK